MQASVLVGASKAVLFLAHYPYSALLTAGRCTGFLPFILAAPVNR